MSDGHNENHESTLFNGSDNAVIADAVTPQAFQISRQRPSEASGVFGRSDALAQVPENQALRFGAEFA